MNAEPKEPSLDQCRKPEDRDKAREHHEGSYYYDDAHGYETYDPESDDADEVEDEGTRQDGYPDQKSL